MSAVVWETNFPGLTLLSRGKVRDLYEVGGDLLLVATDRLSAFDVVLPTPIPDKGRVLTQLSLFWFETLRDVVPNHVLSATEFPGPGGHVPRAIGGPLDALPQDQAAAHRMRGAWLPGRLGTGRTTARRAKICGIALPPGLRESDRLPDRHFHAFHQGHHGPRRKYFLR